MSSKKKIVRENNESSSKKRKKYANTNKHKKCTSSSKKSSLKTKKANKPNRKKSSKRGGGNEQKTYETDEATCKNYQWKNNKGFTDEYGHKRYWFDCGEFYFDGKFNVVKFRKGLSLYHGSLPLVYYNAQMPLGVGYFDINPDINSKLSKEDILFLKSDINSNIDKLKLLDSKQKISTGWYGDFEVATKYSTEGGITMPYPENKNVGVWNIIDEGNENNEKNNMKGGNSERWNIIDESKNETWNVIDEYDKDNLSNDTTPTIIVPSKENDLNDNPITLKCGDKCISAFKLKEDAIFVDLFDPMNIKILLEKSYLSDIQKNILKDSQVFGKSDAHKSKKNIDIHDSRQAIEKKKKFKDEIEFAYHPLKQFNGDLRRDTMRRMSLNDPYELPNALVDIFASLGYAGYVNPRVPYEKNGTATGNYRFAEMVFGKHIKTYIERDYNNPSDWQYMNIKDIPTEMRELLIDMDRYKTTNIDFHSGDLLEHSIWTMLNIENMFNKNNKYNKWVSNISLKYNKLLSITGLLHDIGKGGDNNILYYDKKDHPLEGYKYLNKQNKYILENGDSIDFDTLINDIGFHNEDIKLMKALIMLHWEFGGYMKKLSNSVNYKEENLKTKNLDHRSFDIQSINNLYDEMEEIGNKFIDHIENQLYKYKIYFGKEQKILFYKMLMALSVADVLSTQPYIDFSKFIELTKKINNNVNIDNYDLNVSSQYLTFIKNKAKVHRGINAYEKFDFENKGYKFRNLILKLLEERNETCVIL